MFLVRFPFLLRFGGGARAVCMRNYIVLWNFRSRIIAKHTQHIVYIIICFCFSSVRPRVQP